MGHRLSNLRILAVCISLWGVLALSGQLPSSTHSMDCPATFDHVSAPSLAPAAPVSVAERVTDLLEQSDPATLAARTHLLKNEEVVSLEEGGMGFMFTLRNKTTGKEVCYKGIRPDKTNNETKARFMREAALAFRMGRAGVGPRTRWKPELKLIQMVKISGHNLKDFRREVLSKMNPKEQSEWFGNFVVAMAEKVKRLHHAGVLHRDIKPSNIMIPTENRKGKKILLIDFGLSQLIAQLSKAQPESQGGIAGTWRYLGRGAASGKAGIADDLEALALSILDALPEAPHEKEAPLYEHPLLKTRPELRAVLALLREPAPPTSQIESDYKLLSLSSESEKSPYRRAAFWQLFVSRFSDRTPGQRLKLLFSDPVIFSHREELGLDDAKLKDLIDRGMKENGWLFSPRKKTVKSLPEEDFVAKTIEEERAKDRDLRLNPDFAHLFQVREALGAIPASLCTPPEMRAVRP